MRSPRSGTLRGVNTFQSTLRARYARLLVSLAAVGCCVACSRKASPHPPNAGVVDRVLTSARARVFTAWSVDGQAGPDVKPNAEGQRPAQPDQTRAPLPPQVSRVKVELVAKGLREPWAVEVLPDGRFVVTERGG